MENTPDYSFLIAFLIGTLATLILAVAIIVFVIMHQRRVIKHQIEMKDKEEEMQRELLRATIQSQEEEQRRIARDLHDDLGPMLSAIKLRLSKVRKIVLEHNADTESIDDSRAMLDETITQVRNISHQLLPPVIDKYGLAAALEDSCKKMNSDALNIEFTQHSYTRIDAERELALYRVVMELLNNTIKHSGATLAKVSVELAGGQLQISVTDNGKGFDTANLGMKAGLGIKNIISRVKAINADLNFTSSPAGTTALIKMAA